MRIVCISDTHERHDEITVPEGDVLICAGDVTASGQLRSLERFILWFRSHPHRHKLLVAGNHDFCFEKQPAAALEIVRAPSVHYLQDCGITIDGLRFWGSPWQPEFFNWAFNLPRGDALAQKWSAIPDGTDVLITHGPPFGTLDVIPNGMRVGCEALAERLETLSVRLHVFGHIHHSHGAIERQGRISVNASICDERYMAVHQPVVIDL